ncbi:LLM class flavin-dependent oxidoreductase [Roseomonas hellenica]|uniref:LLM class flavin-dependent oxidoreductase n=1 Tax=Plastoroseomonas hellenica TaxID=2687306 RepID=A0ABS5ESD2_9PROT|nr:LLM class flavin-dependent oxidoreductase [Plastoroseomonas hellenica]MBR0663212.1 LLM class flavin-dependent oxidoreductase [Plastoroseomonas hellenica]
MMSLFSIPNMVGAHLGAWRHPEAYANPVMNLDYNIETAKLAERGKFDGLFLADGNAVRDMDKPALFAANSPVARPAVYDPVILLTALAMSTSRIGVVSTATASFDQPYFIARRFASLDHVSKGRAGWNLVTNSYAGDALNFNRSEPVSREERYERAEEFIEVVKGLWDSWADDAFVQDKATGQFLDPDRVHVLNHQGKHFQVQGPLNVTRSPQGRPVVFMAGQSERGKELAARHADAMFGAGDSRESMQADYANIKARMAKYGRHPDELKFIPGVSIFVGRTSAEADELYEELNALISPTLGVHYLSKIVTWDLSGYPIDGPLPDEIPETVVGGSSTRTFTIRMAREKKLSIRQTYQQVVPAFGSPVIKGSPAEVADQMADWYRSKVCDGFMVSMPIMPRGLRDFVGLVVPELQRRGVFRTEYEGTTLREHMGLAKPASAYFPARSLAAD